MSTHDIQREAVDYRMQELTQPKLTHYLGGCIPQTPLKVGFFTTDHWFEPHAAGTRAVEETIRALEQGEALFHLLFFFR